MTNFQYIDKELEEIKHNWYQARAQGKTEEVQPVLLEQCFFVATLIKEIRTTPFNFVQKYYRKKYLFDIAIDIHEDY